MIGCKMNWENSSDLVVFECLQLWVGGPRLKCDIIVIEKVVLCVKQSQFYSDIFPDVNCIYKDCFIICVKLYLFSYKC